MSDENADRKLDGKAKGFAVGCLTQYSLYREAEDN